MNLSTNNSASPQKKPYRFDLSFDDGLNDDTPQILTNGEIKNLKATSYQEGHTDGEKKTQESLTASIKIILETLYFDLNNLLQSNKDYQDAVAVNAMHLLKEIMEKVAPFCIYSTLFEEITKEVKKHLSQQQDALQLTLDVHPDILKPFEEYIQEFEPELPKKMRLNPNETFGVGTYKLNWDVGFLQKRGAEILEEVGVLITRLSEDLSQNNPYLQMTNGSSAAENEKTTMSEAQPGDSHDNPSDGNPKLEAEHPSAPQPPKQEE